MMRPALIGLLAVHAALLCSPQLAQGEPARVHDGESEPVKAWRAAVERGDLDTLGRMHGPRTVAFPPSGTVVRGDEAIMAGYKSLFADDIVTVTIEDAHWIEEPPLVVSWGLTTLTLHPRKGGKDIVSHTRFTDAAIRVPDGWRYVVDHASPLRRP